MFRLPRSPLLRCDWLEIWDSLHWRRCWGSLREEAERRVWKTWRSFWHAGLLDEPRISLNLISFRRDCEARTSKPIQCQDRGRVRHNLDCDWEAQVQCTRSGIIFSEDFYYATILWLQGHLFQNIGCFMAFILRSCDVRQSENWCDLLLQEPFKAACIRYRAFECCESGQLFLTPHIVNWFITISSVHHVRNRVCKLLFIFSSSSSFILPSWI